MEEIYNKDELMKNIFSGDGSLISQNNSNNVIEVEIDKIKDFYHGKYGHVFEVADDDDMKILEEQIIENGILEPVIIREDSEPGFYELISGHRRKYVAEKVGIKSLKAVVVTYTDDEAIRLMVSSNLTKRSNYKPSVLAKAYRSYMDANKSQGKRTDLTSRQVGEKLNTNKLSAERFKQSERNIQRYIRLSYLSEMLLSYVDSGKLKLTPAIELSYLDRDRQQNVETIIYAENIKVSLEDATELKRLYQAGKLNNVDDVYEILVKRHRNEEKQVKIRISEQSISKLMPKDTHKWVIDKKYEFIKAAISRYIEYIDTDKTEKERWK